MGEAQSGTERSIPRRPKLAALAAASSMLLAACGGSEDKVVIPGTQPDGTETCRAGEVFGDVAYPKLVAVEIAERIRDLDQPGIDLKRVSLFEGGDALAPLRESFCVFVDPVTGRRTDSYGLKWSEATRDVRKLVDGY